MATDSEKTKTAVDAGQPSPELRLLDRRAFIGFPPLALAPGVVVTEFALQVPDVTFPFNLSGGPSRYQRKTLQLGFLELQIDAEVVSRKVQELSARLLEIEELKLFFRPGYLEGQGRLKGPERTPLTFKLAFDGDGEKLAVYLYDVRLYGFSATPAAQVAALVSRAVAELDLLPGVELRGATGFTTCVLPPLCQAAAVSRGYRLPSLDQARLSAAEISAKGLKLRFASGGLPPPASPDEDLLLALEGARAFADAEQLVAQGKLAEARAAYLKLGDVQDAHPFAAERLLALLAADPQAQELALDVAAAALRRRERSATALWAEAVVRERRGEAARAAERFLALCSLARKGQEESSAFFAAEAAARAAGDEAPQLKVKALHELLGVRPDHLPSLQALARASDQAQDRAGAIRAYRRIAALARDPHDAAEAHVQLARLCAETEDDVAGARLHCDAALKLAPDHPEALLRLGELCHRAGEHLRGLKALDRLREVAMARHEIELVGRASLAAGRIWDQGLGQLENALLRFREAASLLPGEPEPHFQVARTAERLQKLQEAVSGFQQCIELAGPAPKSEATRKAAHASHHALARLTRTRLADPVRAREHLEAALALEPRDTVALEELIPYFRATGKIAELADACQNAAAATDDPARRAVYWAEAGELYRGRLADAEKAERLLNAAVEADPKSRVALEGLLALAESRRDGGQLCRCLKALAELTGDPKERARLFRRLAVAARDLAFDLDLATQALSEVLKVEPEDLSALGELCGLHRKRADMAGLAQALEQRARIAEAQGDRRLASAALREMSQVLELRLGRVGEALVALEKAARLAPDHGVLLELADLSLRCERPDHARKALEDLLAQLPAHAAAERIAEIRSRLGKACELVGDRDGAKAHYAAAFPARKLDDALAGRLEVLYQDAGQFRELGELWADRARALMEAQRREAAAPLFLRSARALLDLGDRTGALERLGTALDAAPEGPNAAEILEVMAALQLERGAKLEASGLLARRAVLLPRGRDPARLLYQAATLCPGTPRELEYLTQAIDQDPAFAPARVRRAELAADTDAVAALADLELALAAPALDPDAPTAADRVRLSRRAATAARRAGRSDVARKHLSAYVADHPDDLDAQLEVAGLHRQAGAREALCDLLGGLWRRLAGEAQRSALREYAELCIELSRTHSAVEALRSVLSRDPEDAWAVRALLGLLPDASATAAEEAERLHLYGVLIAHAPRDEKADLLARRAALHRGAQRWDEARADFLAAAELSAHPRELLRGAAEAARALGDERGEISTWRAAVARDPALAEEARDRLLALARARLAAQDPLSARAAYEAALSGNLAPEVRAEAQLGIARAALAQGDRPGALAAFRAASAEGPSRKRVEAALELADLHERAGAREDAAQALELALALSPGHPAATEHLQRVLRALEDWQGLAELLASEARHAPKPKAIELLLELAQLYEERLGLPAPAEAALRRVVQLDRSRGDVYARLASLLFDRGDVEEGARALEQAAAGAGASAPELLWGGAETCAESGQPELALRLARKAAELEEPEGADALLLGRLLYAAGARGEAMPVFEALAQATSFDGEPEAAEEVRLALADLALDKGDAHRAERVLRAILAARPHSFPAAERLAELLHPRSPRDAIEVLVTHAFALSASHRAAERLLWLAERADRELADQDLAVRCLTRAAEIAPEPLAVHRRLAELYRSAGRAHELDAELEILVELSLAADYPYGAIEAIEERARLAEEGGRVDSALATLERARKMWEEQGSKSSAAAVERRRAELLRDAKLDLAAAAEAFERAFALAPELEVAQLALTLARRREDHRGEAAWLRRAAELTADPKARGILWLDLSRVHDGVLASPRDAEDAVREALRVAPELPGAEALLVRLLEREGRIAELAAFYEESAGRAPDARTRASLFRHAADIYRTRAKDPNAAATALLAARAAVPDDLAVTAQAADLLHEVGRRDEAAEFDALLLAADPLREAVFDRHRAYLEAAGDLAGIGELWVHRAERQGDEAAAQAYLEAAQAFRRAGAPDRAGACEDQAFEADPASDGAYAKVCAKAQGDVRELSELMAARAHALGGDAEAGLLRQRAQLLLDAGEDLLAAAAFDDLLAVAGEDVSALATRGDLAAKSGGPAAAEPYDRRVLAAGGTALPVPAKLKAQLRLGSASLSKGAFRDAADSFEAVVALDPSGERGREALSLLSEVYARTQDTQGLYRTSLALAERARPAEADALLRRAADLFEDPSQAIDALLPLARSHPADPALVDRAAAGLRALARNGELVELYERGADAAGGARAAELLLAAAKVASDELGDPARAAALTERAAAKDPANLPALRAVLAQQRARGETPGVVAALERVIGATEDPEERAALRLELAELALSLADRAQAHAALAAVMEQGPAVSAYQRAVEQLARLLADGGDRVELGRVLAARAELASGAERAEFLVLAAKAFQKGGDLPAAAERARAAVELVPALESFVLLASLHKALGQHLPAADALEKAAGLSAPEARAPLLAEAAEEREAGGDKGRAAELLEELAEEAPALLPPEKLASRLVALGAHARAAAVGFAPALAAGDLERALSLAEAAKDAAKVRKALWAMMERGTPGGVPLPDVAARLRDGAGPEELLRLASACERHAPGLAPALYEAVASGASNGVALRSPAVDRLLELSGAAAVVERILPALAAERALVDRVLSRCRAAEGLQRAELLRAAASALPKEQRPLLAEALEEARSAGAAPLSAELVDALAALEQEPKARAALWAQAGELRAKALADRAGARAAYERALADDAESVAALQGLLELDDAAEPARFLELAGRLERLAGAEALSAHAEKLAEAYERAGRRSDAYQALARLPETPERLERRAKLAGLLGKAGESLQLRERAARDPAQLERILYGYVEAGLHAFASRLGAKLDPGKLLPQTRRFVAERLSSSRDGAALAARFWPDLLRADVNDADGWTLFAEALRHDGREEQAALVDGIGAALTNSQAATVPPAPSALHRAEEPPFDAQPTSRLVPITALTMPRLFTALSGVLGPLGAESVLLSLSPEGGVEAYLARPDELVIGASALAVFGPGELAYLVALALALGSRGAALTRPGEPAGFPEAAAQAIAAVPGTLAAGRVLAQLDASVRGGDPLAVDASAVLRKSAAFRAMALKLLELV